MYSHTQIGYAAIVILLFTLFIMLQIKTSWFMYGVIGLCMILMSTLTVKVTDKDLVWFFGPYFLKKSISIKDIEEISTVKTSWLNGLGIRHLGNAVLYNVSGLEAIEIKLKNNEIIMIGTGEPKKLLDAINSKMSNSKNPD